MRSWTSFLNRIIAIPFVLAALLCGCGQTSSAIVKEVSSKTYPSPIMVFPPENLGESSVPLKDIRGSLVIRLKRTGTDITQVESMDNFLSRHRIRYTGGIDLETARAMRKETGAEAVLLTSVGFYSEMFPPKIALSSRLVSTETLKILWVDSVGLSGDDSPGILGLGLVKDPKVLLEMACEQLLNSLSRFPSGNGAGALTGRKRRKYSPESQYRSSASGPDFKPYVVSFSLPEFRGEKRADIAILDVTLRPPSKNVVTIDYEMSGGTEKGTGLDHRLKGGTLTFAPGETKKTIKIDIGGNALAEEVKTIEAVLSNPRNAVLGGCNRRKYFIAGRSMKHGETTPGKGVLPEVTFDRASQAVSESLCGVTARIVLSSVTDRDVMVPFTFGGTARDQFDYSSATENPLVIRAGAQSAEIVVALVDDNLSEADRTLEVSMGVPINASPGTVRKQTITIKDDDKKQTIAVVPFHNQSSRINAGEMVALHFIQQLREASDFQVVEPGEVREKLLDLRIIMEDGISLSHAEDLFRRLDADLILTGRVMDYQDAPGSGLKPVVDFSVLVIERERGLIVWESRSRNRGDDGVFLFDWGLVRSADRLANGMVDSVVRKMLK